MSRGSHKTHLAAMAFLVATLASACGPTHFSIHSVRASRHLAQARQMGAQEYAPYEYLVATEHLDKAKEEAGKAEYQDAVALAKIADEHAQKAVQVAREARGGER